MKPKEELGKEIRNYYSSIALSENRKSCCTPLSQTGTCFTNLDMSDDYSEKPGYEELADLGLGCGTPVDFAGIKPGNMVLDIGSGAGNDCFIAARESGANGKVIGLDMTPEMISLSKRNAGKLNIDNVEFLFGEAESIPLTNNSIDVVISNCVLNLVIDKAKAYSEIYRVLKPGGRISISDTVSVKTLPDEIKRIAAYHSACISGAAEEQEYLEIILNAGFENLEIRKRKVFEIPNEYLGQYLPENEISKDVTFKMYSLTITAEKPAIKD
ncbi:MAG: methyltransferase domain-containing protein [Bacteroidetes bacterium]|nr:MAG: methyltransferase domain-containing protein [Bacteroidota bacterium]REK03535.1 MAG: methyltransferase domain-containing protein [Bacteroidota bacterium]REK34838.1 MAG: methyltransferase domain-containing protein [Bacteroidota bacterium]REK51209.1 MAG: methyltransferase domain-containing protein [Bacteroidota bacterium]